MLLAGIKANPDDVYYFVEEPLLPTRLPFLQSENGHDDPLPGWRINICFLFNATGTIMCPPLLIFRADDAIAQGLETPPGFTVFVRHSVDGFVTPEELGQLQYIIDEFVRPGHTLMHVTDYAHCELTLLPPRVQRTINDTPAAEDGREITLQTHALTSLSTEQDRRKRKVKQELPHPRTVTSAGSSVRGAGEVPPPPNDDVIARLARPNYQRDFQALALYGPHGVGCQLPAQDVLTLEDGQCLADTVDYLAIPVYYEGHYSLVIATKLRTMVSGKLSETAEGSVELVHYDSAQLHTKRPEVMEGVKKMLLMLHKAQLPTADRKQAEDHLKYAEVTIMHPEDIPQQSNAIDCGIYVGMYLHTLVSSGFSTLKEWMSFYGVKSHAYRRQLREEVSLHTTGDLFVKLLGEGVDVPVQPLPQLGEHGALVFPKEDEVRTDLARQSGMITWMEVGGYVVCAAVMCLTRSLGISEDQLLSGAAHKLQAHGTPLLAVSTSKNHVDHVASMRTLGMTIHPTPCPIPVPSFPPAHFDGASTIQMDPTPTVANPMRAEQDHPTAPVTPAAPPTVSRVAKYTTRQGSRTASRAVRQTSTGQQIRLGAYNVELDAAYAYAATAFVIRRKDHIPHTKELSDAEKASLDGCVRDDVRHLVKARMWWRWRQWRTAMAELGIAPGTPFPLENHGTRSTSNSSGDDDVEDRMVETGSG
ncbi:unnamed protein product [Closterium sp. NIES-65]|nr:unnamed protein product [Closterium sp. NIES-65]